MKCSTTAPMQAWRNVPPPEFKILSARQLPWKEGVLYWHLANFSNDLPEYQQIGIFKDVFSVYHHELWPLRFQSTDDINLADHKIFFVDENDKIKGTDQDSPFAFKQAPEVLAVQYIYYPGFEWSMCMFVSDKHFYSTKQVEGGLELRKIILHEGLHALGLDHTSVKGDIMEAVYDPLNDFTDDSRTGLNKIHGAARRGQLTADPAAAFFISKTIVKKTIMNDPKWYGILRHVLTLIGGVMVAFGLLEGEEVERGIGAVMGVVGAVITLFAFIASIRAREKQISNVEFKRMKR